MEKIDVAIQSYKKPESLIYTLFSLKKSCGNLIDTIFINDDCSGPEITKMYKCSKLSAAMKPIKIVVRVNEKPSGYNITLMTKDSFKKRNVINRIQILSYFLINRLSFHRVSDDVRYQWAINNTDKKYLLIIHDDIKFYDDIVGLYLDCFMKDKHLAIVGDLGGERLCPYGPCGEKCSPQKILEGIYPCKTWPVMGYRTIFHKIMGRYRRDCRINEWCCMINIDAAKEIYNKFGVFFGNYEAGGDVATYWLDRAINLKYKFTDPLPKFEDRKRYYVHWWQGHEGHEVWVDYGRGKQPYRREFITKCIKDEFGYDI